MSDYDMMPHLRHCLIVANSLSVVSFCLAILARIACDKYRKEKIFKEKRFIDEIYVSAFQTSCALFNNIVINGLIFGGIGCVVSQKPLGEIFVISFGASAAFAISVLTALSIVHFCRKKESIITQRGLTATMDKLYYALGIFTLPGFVLTGIGLICESMNRVMIETIEK